MPLPSTQAVVQLLARVRRRFGLSVPCHLVCLAEATYAMHRRLPENVDLAAALLRRVEQLPSPPPIASLLSHSPSSDSLASSAVAAVGGSSGGVPPQFIEALALEESSRGMRGALLFHSWRSARTHNSFRIIVDIYVHLPARQPRFSGEPCCRWHARRAMPRGATYHLGRFLGGSMAGGRDCPSLPRSEAAAQRRAKGVNAPRWLPEGPDHIRPSSAALAWMNERYRTSISPRLQSCEGRRRRRPDHSGNGRKPHNPPQSQHPQHSQLQRLCRNDAMHLTNDLTAAPRLDHDLHAILQPQAFATDVASCYLSSLADDRSSPAAVAEEEDAGVVSDEKVEGLQRPQFDDRDCFTVASTTNTAEPPAATAVAISAPSARGRREQQKRRDRSRQNGAAALPPSRMTDPNHGPIGGGHGGAHPNRGPTRQRQPSRRVGLLRRRRRHRPQGAAGRRLSRRLPISFVPCRSGRIRARSKEVAIYRAPSAARLLPYSMRSGDCIAAQYGAVGLISVVAHIRASQARAQRPIAQR